MNVLRNFPKNRVFRRQISVCLILTILLFAGCSVTRPTDSDVDPDNARLAAEIKIALVASPELSAAAIDVVADDGRVSLNGFVELHEQKQQVADVVGALRGVTDVANNIVVKSK